MFRKFSEGFITAIGTPLDESGEVMKESLEQHVQDQVDNGIDGILCMGTMGMQPIVRATVFPQVAKTVADLDIEAPVMVGCMDNSIGRVKDRIRSLQDCDIDGIALTTPPLFRAISKGSPSFLVRDCRFLSVSRISV
ncbi:hypothetical protein AKJ51_05140 [candidate division MSBL1 archaeon SCGC-AAA382A20]|uniref:Dihydrodipicolinate synthase n=1 Tax=candidate division MSBL1 archaeon SCGC-AAA382A20 TaxID=1698280 RepID=A0A133VFY8_9EURY|nr:hypothetical protein AKJ51_05140 [candidate division MSBL1 archaeon SCGC-AAA382A20]